MRIEGEWRISTEGGSTDYYYLSIMETIISIDCPYRNKFEWIQHQFKALFKPFWSDLPFKRQFDRIRYENSRNSIKSYQFVQIRASICNLTRITSRPIQLTSSRINPFFQFKLIRWFKRISQLILLKTTNWN